MTHDASERSGLSARDRHLFAPGAKRILAIDGGGVRGVVALAFLDRIERVLEAQSGRPVRLCDHFDLIGGTSTGAIIATGLALGHRVAQIRDFYFELGPRVFKRPALRLPGWHAKFDAAALARELRGVIGSRKLDSTDLQTGLGIMLKRVDTGSAWILTNSPRSVFWETPGDRSFIGNRHYSLANVVRASTAAPHFFDPQEIEIVEGEPPGLFVDGALTPHNNPSLALLMAAILPGHGLAWPAGRDNLTVVSIGVGAFRDRLHSKTWRRSAAAALAVRAMIQQVNDSQSLILTLMSWFGECATSWPVNIETGDLASVEPPMGALFRFFRYDLMLETAWLRQSLGAEVSERTLKHLRQIDDPHAMTLLEELAKDAAQRAVLDAHLTPSAEYAAAPSALA
jgi:predicted acylesterase/phospholipase RssA